MQNRPTDASAEYATDACGKGTSVRRHRSEPAAARPPRRSPVPPVMVQIPNRCRCWLYSNPPLPRQAPCEKRYPTHSTRYRPAQTPATHKKPQAQLNQHRKRQSSHHLLPLHAAIRTQSINDIANPYRRPPPKRHPPKRSCHGPHLRRIARRKPPARQLTYPSLHVILRCCRRCGRAVSAPRGPRQLLAGVSLRPASTSR